MFKVIPYLDAIKLHLMIGLVRQISCYFLGATRVRVNINYHPGEKFSHFPYSQHTIFMQWSCSLPLSRASSRFPPTLPHSKMGLFILAQLLYDLQNLTSDKPGVVPLDEMPASFSNNRPLTQMWHCNMCKTLVILMPSRVEVRPCHDFRKTKCLNKIVSK